MIILGRRVEFEASHFYRLPELSEEENRRRFGRVANSHGHNWVLFLAVAGTVDPTTGMVVNIKEIDQLLKETVVAELDHRCLNLDHPAFCDRLPTTENLSLYVWERVNPLLPARCSLHSVEVRESEQLWAAYRGERNPETGMPRVYLTRAYEFSASHRLHNPALSDEENRRLYGKCNNPNGHGHNYRVEVTLVGESDPRLGMIADLETVDAVVHEEILDRLDYKHLNTDVPVFQTTVPTSENVARFIYESLAPRLNLGRARLYRVRLYETPKSWFDYGEQ